MAMPTGRNFREGTGTDAGGYWRYYKNIYEMHISFKDTYYAMRDKLFQVLIWLI